MRLLIDCFKLIKGTGKSIGIYNVALGIVKHLGEMNCFSEGDNVEILVLGNKENKKDFDTVGINFIEITKYDPLNKIHVLLWELFVVSKVCKQLKADKVFFPRGFSALTHPVYDIILIHDLIPFYYHENFNGFFNKIENAYIMMRLKQSARTVKKVITISQSSKNDIVRYCGVDADKIKVINNACQNITASIGKKSPPYICAMTSSLPHKNAKGIIASYVNYCNICDNPKNLVVIGLKDTSSFDIPVDVRNRITCHKFIKNNYEMYNIIANSELFLFLSLIEGFGLPPIEAMQLGVPVVCSNTSSLPEVVGDAAIMVDPFDYDKVAYELCRLTSDKDICDSLVKKGKKNVERFLWSNIQNLYWNELIERDCSKTDD